MVYMITTHAGPVPLPWYIQLIHKLGQYLHDGTYNLYTILASTSAIVNIIIHKLSQYLCDGTYQLCTNGASTFAMVHIYIYIYINYAQTGPVPL